MASLKLNDFDTYATVYDDYLRLRRTLSVAEAEESILRDYGEELDDNDDAPFVWIALAKAQIRKKELTDLVVRHSEESMNVLINEIGFSQSYFQQFKNKLLNPQYRIDVQKLHLKPKPYKSRFFQIPWNYGDVFALRLTSSRAKELGIDGGYALLHMVDQWEGWPYEGERTLPIVYVSIWNNIQLPQTVEEIQRAHRIPVGSQKRYLGKKEYRLMIDFTAYKQLENFIFVGNVPEIKPTCDEIIIEKIHTIYKCSFPTYSWYKSLEEDICIMYEKYVLNAH